MKYKFYLMLACGLLCDPSASIARAADWLRFRGPNGSGISSETSTPPTMWGMQENIRWRTELPGPGLSSPIVVGSRVFVTCYSGYGDQKTEGSIEDLKRHLVCVDRNTGKILWTATIPAVQPEDPYSPPGVTSHGYASHTPTSDGERVYVFFGKTGVIAFDLKGQQLWQTSVGTQSGRQRWGSAASPILVEGNVIVNASDESEALIALDKMTGKEIWRAEATGLASSWATPLVAKSANGDEIVLSVPYETWSFFPTTGKLKWYAKGNDDTQTSSSLITADDMVYSFGGRGGNSIAIRTGGKDDVNSTNIVWQGRSSVKFTTPILFNGYVFNMNGGIATCFDAKTGERKYQSRLATGAAVSDEEANAGRGGPRGPGGLDRGPRGDSRGNEQTPQGDRGNGKEQRGRPDGEGQGGRGGRGGGGGDYASPVITGGKIIYTSKAGRFYVVDATPEFKLVAVNDLSEDTSGFDGTPAISDGELFLRSNAFLYCVSQKQ